jgi:hypothetical protein
MFQSQDPVVKAVSEGSALLSKILAHRAIFLVGDEFAGPRPDNALGPVGLGTLLDPRQPHQNVAIINEQHV